MSDKTPGQPRESLIEKFPIVFANDSDETIPPFSIAKMVDASGVPINKAQRVSVEKPDGSGQHLFTWPFKVKAGKTGRGRLADPATVTYDGDPPEPGDTVGPVDDSWSVSAEGSGYHVIGGAEDGVVLVQSSSGVGIRWARVYGSNIAAATGPLAADWKDGNVKFQDDNTGVLDSNPTAVKNVAIGVSFEEDSQVVVATQFSPPRILGGTCHAVAWS